METIVTDSVEEAARHLRAGELVAFPTETVYGLGADAFSEAAVRSIFAAKERPADNPLIVHIARREQIPQLCREVPPTAEALIERFFPGPLTLILPRSAELPAVVSAGLDTVGIRMPRHPLAATFLRACARPVAAPSANRSGRPSPTTWEAVREDLEGRIRCILRGERTEVGLESTVVDCTREAAPAVLRAGAVSLEALRDVVPNVTLATGAPQGEVRSPGQRHRHYAPRAEVRVVDSAAEAAAGQKSAFIGLRTGMKERERFARFQLCESVETYAHALFDFFRKCDAENIETIYCQRVPEEGLGLALMDRIRRASKR